MNKASLGALAVVVAALLWSLDGYLRQSLYSLPPSVVIFWEHLFGLVVLLPYILFTAKKFKTLSKQQWKAMILVSFLSGALGTVLYTAAIGSIQYIPFSVVVLLQQLQPIFAISAAALLLREPISKRFIEWSILAIVAAYFVSFPDLRVSITWQDSTFWAALMAIGAAASWGASTAFSKYSLKGTSSMHVTAVRFALTPIFAMLFIVSLGQTASLTALTVPQWQSIALITFSTGMVALAIYYFGLQRIPASRSTILELTWPLSASLVGYLFLGDRLTVTQWIGAAILLFCMTMIVKDVKRLDEKKAATVLAADITA